MTKSFKNKSNLEKKEEVIVKANAVETKLKLTHKTNLKQDVAKGIAQDHQEFKKSQKVYQKKVTKSLYLHHQR
jgi:hypothetical protein